MRCAPLRRSLSALLGLSVVGAVLVATGPAEQSDTRPVSQSRPTNAGFFDTSSCRGLTSKNLPDDSRLETN